jgi:hypothetical protein
MWKKILVINTNARRQATAAITSARELAAATGAEIVFAELAEPMWALRCSVQDLSARERTRQFMAGESQVRRITRFVKRENIDVVVIERSMGASLDRFQRSLLRDVPRPVCVCTSDTTAAFFDGGGADDATPSTRPNCRREAVVMTTSAWQRHHPKLFVDGNDRAPRALALWRTHRRRSRPYRDSLRHQSTDGARRRRARRLHCERMERRHRATVRRFAVCAAPDAASLARKSPARLRASVYAAAG